MTTSNMENQIWKKLRNEQQQQQQLTNNQQQQQQQQQRSIDSTDLNNLTSTINFMNLNSMMMFPDQTGDYNTTMNGGSGSSSKYGLPLNSISTNKVREIGCIEKMLTSYGFVNCIDREGRYFFHYSSYQGDVNTLKPGDIIEFEESIDKRTGKPIAINLTKAASFSKNQDFYDLPNVNLASANNHNNTNTTNSNNNENFNNLLANLANSQFSTNFSSNINGLMKQKSMPTGSGGSNSSANQQQQQQQNQLIQALLKSSSTLSVNHQTGDQMCGSIAIPSKKDFVVNGALSMPDGRITYEKNGESFYIPYARNDVINALSELKFGDKVRFFIVQNGSTGFIYARRVEPISLNQQQSPPQPKVITRGIVISYKDTFGKIEREDVGKEIFFHNTDVKSGIEVCVGANVEFEIQDKHGKEIATNIKLLPPGSVSFDEISKIAYIGRILKPAANSKDLQGKIIFDCSDAKLVEMIFSERDRVGEFTLLEGDIVQFKVATDKRTKFKRAVEVLLMEQLNNNNKEKRECGVIEKMNDSNRYGVIKSVERDELVYFAINELICLNKMQQKSLSAGDCVDFGVVECQKDSVFKSGLKAIRIKILPANSVKFEIVSTETYIGYIEKECVEVKAKGQDKLNANRRSETSLAQQQQQQQQQDGANLKPSAGLQSIASSPSFSTLIQQQKNEEGSKLEPGIIKYEINGEIKQIPYFSLNVCQTTTNQKPSKTVLHYLDKVEFNIHTVLRDKKRTAVNVKLVEKHVEQGFVTVLKDSYGFIEMLSQPKDLFFHYSSTLSETIDVGDEVEFHIRKNNDKMNAENVVKLPQGTIKTHNLVPFVYKGRILQPLRSVNHDQDEYYGKVQIADEGQNGDVYQFGISGLSDKKVLLLAGDIVSFQIGISTVDGSKKAFNIIKKEQNPIKAKIDSLKAQFGFIDFPIGDSKKLIFYYTDVENVSQNDLKPGDELEFSISYNNRAGKYFAHKIKKLNVPPTNANDTSKRPERLITKLKTTNIDQKSGKQLILVRQPRNPDMKMKSFTKQRIERKPGQLTTSETTPTAESSTTATTTTKNNDEPKISHFNNLIS